MFGEGMDFQQSVGFLFLNVLKGWGHQSPRASASYAFGQGLEASPRVIVR